MKGARIFVVDDEPAIVSMLEEFLSAFGAQVDSYTCPRKALSAFTMLANEIDLVITDQTMPGMTGMLLSESMLKINPKLPIILCTGYCKVATAETVLQLGVSAFFLKPVKMADLIWKVQDLLHRKPI